MAAKNTNMIKLVHTCAHTDASLSDLRQALACTSSAAATTSQVPALPHDVFV